MTDSYLPMIRREPFLVAYWRLNDDSGSKQVSDSSAHFDLVGSYSIAQFAGPPLLKNDAAAASSIFGATSGLQVQTATVADVSQLHITGDLSLEAWMVIASASKTAGVITKQNSGNTRAGPYALRLSTGSLVFALGNGTTETTLTSPSVLQIHVPIHVVVTSFRGSMTMYVNGAQVANGSLGAQAVADSAQSLVIGKNGTNQFAGPMSEVAIYNGALSAKRVARHYAIGAQVIAQPAYYKTIDPPVNS